MDSGFVHDAAVDPQLSEAEQRLIAFIRAGTVDAEIAVRLTTTVGQVRARIDTLVERFGLASRAELRVADPASLTTRYRAPTPIQPPGDEPRDSARPAPQAPLAPSRRSRVMPALAGLAAVALFAWAVIAGPFSSASTIAPAPVIPEAALPVIPPGPRVAGQLEVLAAEDLPSGMMLYTVSGSPASLQRIYRSRDGELRTDILLAPAAGQAISSAWALGDGSDLAVAVCVTGACGGSGTRVSDDARAELLRSNDGGVSWRLVGALSGGVEIIGAQGNELIVQRRTRAGIETLLLPSGEALAAPDGAAAGSRPQVVAGQAAWRTGDSATLLDGEGDLLFAFGVDAPSGLSAVRTRSRTTETFAIMWYAQSSAPDELDVTTYIAEAASSGDALNTYVFSGPPLLLGPWIDAHRLIASAWRQPFDGSPTHTAPFTAVIDLGNGTLTPIAIDLPATTGDAPPPAILAAVRGKFVRVEPSPSCVALRAQPSDTSEQLGCVPGPTVAVVMTQRFVNNGGWLFVTLPSGARGWLTTIDPAVRLD